MSDSPTGTGQFDPDKFDAEFARIFGEDMRDKAQAYERNPYQRAVDLERQRLHEENAKLASEVLRLRSTVRDRERMIWAAIAMWLVLLAVALAAR